MMRPALAVSRRTFLGTALAAPPLAWSGAGGDRLSPPPCVSIEPSALTIEALQRRYRRELLDEVLPFWERYGIDSTHGSVICALDHDGTRVRDETFLWFQARGLWVYSHLHHLYPRDPRWLASATRVAAFARRHLRQADGSWAQRVTPAGALIEPANPADVSGLLYMAEGLQEYGASADDPDARRLARVLLRDAVRAADASAAPLRRQGLWFLTLRVATQMLRREADADVEALATRALTAIVEHHYNPETGLNDEAVNADLSRAETARGLTIFGHSLEALWMALDEAHRRGDRRIVDLCATRIQRHLDVGWDRVYGLSHAIRMNSGGYAWPPERPVGTSLEFTYVGEFHYMKSSWALLEALIATTLVLEHCPAAWAADEFIRIQDTLDRLFSLRAMGSPMYLLFADRDVRVPEHATRQDNYHHPRALMLVLESLDRLRAAGRTTLMA